MFSLSSLPLRRQQPSRRRRTFLEGVVLATLLLLTCVASRSAQAQYSPSVIGSYGEIGLNGIPYNQAESTLIWTDFLINTGICGGEIAQSNKSASVTANFNASATATVDQFNVVTGSHTDPGVSFLGWVRFKITGPATGTPYDVTLKVLYDHYEMPTIGEDPPYSSASGTFSPMGASGTNVPVPYTVTLNGAGEGEIELALSFQASASVSSSHPSYTGVFSNELYASLTLIRIEGPHGNVDL